MCVGQHENKSKTIWSMFAVGRLFAFGLTEYVPAKVICACVLVAVLI